MMDDLDACRSFPWGRLTFEDAIKEIKHVMNHLKGEVLAFACIPDLGKAFRIYSDDASEDCPRMCKSQFTKSSLKGYPLEDIYAAVGDTKVINNVLVPTIGEQIMLARIIDEEREYDRQDSLSDTWNYWLNVKQKNIWWKELYELDQAARGVLPKNKDKEKVTFAEGSSSNSGLDSRLQGLEERILEFMGEGFVGLHVTLNSIESKVEPSHGEDMDFPQLKGKRIKKKKLKGKSLKPGSKKRRKVRLMRKLPKITIMSLGLRRIEPMKLQHHHVEIRRRELPHRHVVGVRQWLRGDYCCGRGCGNRGKKQEESCRRRKKRGRDYEIVEEQAGEIVEEYTEEEK
ncbi:unnamed protein product [Brassica oleracea var. botrytis]